MGDTRSKVEGGDHHDLEPEGTREDTRHKIYTGSGSLRPVWSSIAPSAWVVPRRNCGSSARYPALIYIVQGAGS
jgi:hypothetical protein